MNKYSTRTLIARRGGACPRPLACNAPFVQPSIIKVIKVLNDLNDLNDINYSVTNF